MKLLPRIVLSTEEKELFSEHLSHGRYNLVAAIYTDWDNGNGGQPVYQFKHVDSAEVIGLITLDEASEVGESWADGLFGAINGSPCPQGRGCAITVFQGILNLQNDDTIKLTGVLPVPSDDAVIVSVAYALRKSEKTV